jgi:hypothetical protein
VRFVFYLIFIAGIGNAVLRPEVGNPLTLYRFLAPLGLLLVMAIRPMMVLKSIAAFIGFLVYNFALASAYSDNYTEYIQSMVHYFYLFILLVMMMGMKSRYTDFEAQFVRFISAFFVFLLLNLFIEWFIGPYYPNLDVDNTGARSVRAFFWNQNDLAVVICVITWVALALDRFQGPLRVMVVLATIAILWHNDSKAALVSLLLVTLPVFYIAQISAKRFISRSVWLLLFGTMALLVAIGAYALRTADLPFVNETYTLEDLLIRPITRILTLDATGETWGSLNNRTDASIFVIIEYIRSFGFGLGAGGSWLVLSLPQYELGGARSPHNALLQLTVDFGYPVLLGYSYLMYWALRKLFTPMITESQRLKVIAVLSFPLLGLSQSGAIVTNYFCFGVLCFIWLLDRPVPFFRGQVTTPPKARQREETPEQIAAPKGRGTQVTGSLSSVHPL